MFTEKPEIAPRRLFASRASIAARRASSRARALDHRHVDHLAVERERGAPGGLGLRVLLDARGARRPLPRPRASIPR